MITLPANLQSIVDEFTLFARDKTEVEADGSINYDKKLPPLEVVEEALKLLVPSVLPEGRVIQHPKWGNVCRVDAFYTVSPGVVFATFPQQRRDRDLPCYAVNGFTNAVIGTDGAISLVYRRYEQEKPWRDSSCKIEPDLLQSIEVGIRVGSTVAKNFPRNVATLYGLRRILTKEEEGLIVI